jgi:hypothetical protein
MLSSRLVKTSTRQSRGLLENCSGGGDAASVGQLQVHEHDVRTVPGGCSDGGGGGHGGYDLEVGSRSRFA